MVLNVWSKNRMELQVVDNVVCIIIGNTVVVLNVWSKNRMELQVVDNVVRIV